MTIEIKVPDLPESVADATIATWHKKPGDLVARDEVLVDIETDKVVLEVPAPEAGVLGDILQSEGATVLSRQLIAMLKPAPVAGEETKEKPVEAVADDAADGLSPSVRRLVAEHDIDVAKLTGTGKGGRVTKEDVEAFIKGGNKPAAAPVAAAAPAAPVAPLAGRKTTDSIMLAEFPQANLDKIVPAAFEQMDVLKGLVESVRNLRGEMGLGPGVKAPLFVEGGADLADMLKYLPALTRLTEAKLVDKLPEGEDAPIAVCQAARNARLMLKVEIDKAAETARLNKEAEKLQKALDKLEAKLGKPGYTEKAPAHLVEKDKAELADLQDKMAKVAAQLAKLKD